MFERKLGGPPDLPPALSSFPYHSFGGAVAVVDTRITTSMSLATDGDEQQIWAIDVNYSEATARILSVRSVRPITGSTGYATFVESLTSAIVNFELNKSLTAPDPAHVVDSEAQFDAVMATRRELDGLTPESVAISIDAESYLGDMIQTATCMAIEVHWRGQTIFCTGRPDIVRHTALRMEDPATLESVRKL